MKINEYGGDDLEFPFEYWDDEDYDPDEESERLQMDDDNYIDNYINNKNENIKRNKMKKPVNEIKMTVGELKTVLESMVKNKKSVTKPKQSSVNEIKMTVGEFKKFLKETAEKNKSKSVTMDKTKAADLIESMVNKVKKSGNPYKNLGFVDGIVKKFGLNEGVSVGVKNILKESTIKDNDGSKRLYEFISKKCGVKADAVYNQIAEKVAYPQIDETCESCIDEDSEYDAWARYQDELDNPQDYPPMEKILGRYSDEEWADRQLEKELAAQDRKKFDFDFDDEELDESWLNEDDLEGGDYDDYDMMDDFDQDFGGDYMDKPMDSPDYDADAEYVGSGMLDDYEGDVDFEDYEDDEFGGSEKDYYGDDDDDYDYNQIESIIKKQAKMIK